MKIPPLDQAESYISEAQKLNPGPWISHSRHVAIAAQAIAAHHPDLNPDYAYILGYLHDIGRREGVTSIRHSLDGYNFLKERGFDDAARVCITHSFPIKNLNAFVGKSDLTNEESTFIGDFLAKIEYTAYDKLIQLCDALSLPNGICLIEKRIVDVALRYGFNEYTIPRWQTYFAIKANFEKVIGESIYKVLPGVIENTFIL